MNKKLFVILFIVFLDLAGFGIIIPTLPFIAQRFHASATQIGLLSAAYSLFQFFGTPILGRLSDKYGRRPLLMLSLFGSSIGYITIAFASSLPIVFLSRIIDGFTGGNISIAQAYIADITHKKERTKAMGMIGAAFGFGFIFGPLIGGFLSHYGFAIPYIFAAILALLNAILVYIILPETERKSVQKKVHGFFNLSVLKEAMTPRIIVSLTSLFFLVTFAFSLMQGILPLYTFEKFQWGAQANGYFFAYIGLVSIITQGFILRKLVDKASERRLIQISLFILSIGFGLFAFSVTQVIFYIGGLFMAFSFGMLNSSIGAEISKFSLPEEQGTVLGIVQGFNALARTFGPAVGGYLFGHFSITTPFHLATYILIASGIYSVYIYKDLTSH